MDRPTDQPTNERTNRPTDQPTNRPTDQPTDRPTDRPVAPSHARRARGAACVRHREPGTERRRAWLG
ncbi:PT domain-containing protein, partial [Stenotrophomonas sp. NPDC078853]|uniref:PT domain-containing protein n=1 Tax=Stenotrophomonas sp. NPDC078853 TaxID=3364534 RepID=UPI00384CDE6D